MITEDVRVIKIDSNNCIMCGEKAFKLTWPDNPGYYHCGNCDLIFIDKRHYISSSDEIKRYKYHNNSPDNKGYVSYLRGFIKGAQIDEINCNIKALDFGCGPEPVLGNLLLETGINQVDLYDPFFFPDENYKNNRYGLITCTEVLEHLKDPLGTMILLRSLLTCGGLLAIKTMFHINCGDFEKWWYRHDSTHICFYSPNTMRWLGRRLGLDICVLDNHSICVFLKKDIAHYPG